MHFDDFGINVAGFLTAELGLGEVARSYVQAIKHLDMPLSLQDASFITHQRKADTSLSGFSSYNPYPTNLICLNAPEIKHFIDKFGSQYFKTKYNIGSWWWEVEELPADWKAEFYRFDELWVGTNFIRDNFLKVSPIPVFTVPPLVVLQRTGITRTMYDLSRSEFIFLYAFDFFSCFERKNPLAVVEAFKIAFPNEDKVRLVIKCTNGSSFPAQFTQLHQACDHKQITLLDSYMSKKELHGLIENCDCYVSLHRTEGFGLPMAEAMALKKPVIATGWSGNLDFTTAENSLLVKHGFTENGQDYGPYKRGMRWAEPDIEHAAKLMRVMFEDQEHAKALGQRGQATILEKFSKDAVAATMLQRFEKMKCKVHRVEQLAKFKRGLVGLPEEIDLGKLPLPRTAPTAPTATAAVAAGQVQVDRLNEELTLIDDLKLVDSEVQSQGLRAKSKNEILVDQWEALLTKWWHRPVLGAPLRFVTECLKRVVIRALSGEPARIIRSQVLDQTFEGIAQLAKMDAEKIEALENRIKLLEAEAKLVVVDDHLRS
jgi:glycosyltransferase involved in cell wall biosynthesis